MNPFGKGILAVSAAALVTLMLAPPVSASGAHTPLFSMEPQQVREFLEPLGVWVPEARYGVDAYRVVYRTQDVDLAAVKGRFVGGPVSVSGFSQGANASFLLAKALQEGVEPGFGLGALAPISGAYRLFDIEWPAALRGDVESRAATYYLAYLTVAWDRIYDLYRDETQVFKPPYAGHVASLFDGDHSLDETMAALPSAPADLLRPEYARWLLHPTGALERAARLNDVACFSFVPAKPVRMFASHGDPEAVYANSLACKESLRGADVTLTDVGNVDHITSLVLSMPQIARWFATLA